MRPEFQVGLRQNRGAWILATLGSAFLLALVLRQVDLDVLQDTLAQCSTTLIALSIALLCLEGVFASLRLHLFASIPRRVMPPIEAAFRVNAWYVLAIALLPARLGEVAGAILMHRILNMRGGHAAMAIFSQRLFDLAVLAGLVLPVAGIAVLYSTLGSMIVSAFGAALIGGALLVLALSWILLMRPDVLLTPILAFAHRACLFRGRLQRVFQMLLQARSWSRHHYPQMNQRGAVLTTLGKWLANILGLWALIAAFGIERDAPVLWVVAVFYNFLLAVPIPTLGSIGLSEIGLAALLTLIGVPVASAAAISVVARVVLLLLPVLYGGLTWVGLVVLRKVPPTSLPRS